MDYKVKLEAFEGPMDLLLHLIEKNKIDIYDIPISELTQQYIEYVNEAQEFDAELASRFLLMAAILINIKSRMLLPSRTKLKSPTEEDSDPRTELVQKLIEYRRFQKASQELESRLAIEETFIKRSPMELSRRELPPTNLSIKKLMQVFLNVIARNEEGELPKILISPEVFKIKDKMIEILHALSGSNEVKLSDVVETKSVNETVTTFLALLELVKRSQVNARQVSPFDDIVIASTGGSLNAE